MRTFITAALLVVLSPTVAFAATPQTFQDLANIFVVILNNATTVLIVAGIAVYFYGISTNILNFGEKGHEKVKNYFFWGVIVLFVMVSIWGIVNLLQNTLFGDSSFNPTNGSAQTPPNQQFTSPQFSE